MPNKTFFCIDAHTCGNPVRVIAGGGPALKGKDMREKRQHFMREFDWIRTGLMFEPRGHDQMSGSIIYPPTDPENDADVLFIETSGCLPMCGHGTIGTVTVAIQEGLIQPKVEGKLQLGTPAGRISVEYQREGKRVKSVRLRNVAAFLYKEGLEAECPSLGMVRFDISYGGNFYAIIEPQEAYPGMEQFSAGELVEMSRALRKNINAQYEAVHPEDDRIRGISHVLWTGKATKPEAHARNAVFYGDKAIDRSPCGTGTSARMAQLWHRGELNTGEDFVHESIIGSLFKGRVEAESQVGPYRGILPSVEGWAVVTGYNNIFIDPEEDPFAYGFQVV